MLTNVVCRPYLLLLVYTQALQQYKPPEAAARPLTWDQHLLVSISTARRLTGGSMTALGATLEAFVAAKMSGGLQKHPPQCSDLVWAGAGMAVAFLTLGLLAAAAKSLPVVGQWHHHVSETTVSNLTLVTEHLTVWWSQLLDLPSVVSYS